MQRRSTDWATPLSTLAGLALAVAGAFGGLYVRYGLHWGEHQLPAEYCYRDNIMVFFALFPYCALAAVSSGATRGALRTWILVAIPLLGFVLATFVQTYTDSMRCSLLW